jgi:hypothetical protein
LLLCGLLFVTQMPGAALVIVALIAVFAIIYVLWRRPDKHVAVGLSTEQLRLPQKLLIPA